MPTGKDMKAAKENVYENVGQLIKAIGKFDEDIARQEIKDCTFRINRDVRFSKDKSPYKTNIAGYFAKGGKKTEGAGFYVHIEPGAAFAAAGCWWPEPKKLSAIRQEIDYNFDDWKKIIGSKKFKAMFTEGVAKKDTLQRPPKGYSDENPAIEYIKMKSFVVYKYFTDADLQQKDFVKKVAVVFEVAAPMVEFLNNAE